jgi:hypothetical protein
VASVACPVYSRALQSKVYSGVYRGVAPEKKVELLEELEELYGSHALLKRVPWWLVVALVPLIQVTIWFLRLLTEGIGYNISLCAVYGNMWLGIAIAIAGDVLKREQHYGWLTSKAFHIACASSAGAVGLTTAALPVMQRRQVGQITDLLHNSIVVAAWTYSLLTAIPLALWKGTKEEKMAIVTCLLGWMGLYGADAWQGLLAQREYLIDHGFVFPF